MKLDIIHGIRDIFLQNRGFLMTQLAEEINLTANNSPRHRSRPRAMRTICDVQVARRTTSHRGARLSYAKGHTYKRIYPTYDNCNYEDSSPHDYRICSCPPVDLPYVFGNAEQFL